MIALEMTVNGSVRTATVTPETTLLVLLREHFGLTGAKSGCEVGDCGACTVLVGGRAVNACLTLALQADGRDIVTIEGLASHDRLHPLQRVFEEQGALQCGYCGPGVILSAKALLDEHAAPTKTDIRNALAGNLCRCTGYAKIVDAVHETARVLREERSASHPEGSGR